MACGLITDLLSGERTAQALVSLTIADKSSHPDSHS
jgi:hypothetical protein